MNFIEVFLGSFVRLFLNFIGGMLYIDGLELAFIEIYDVNLRFVYYGNSWEINIFGLSKGIYFVKIKIFKRACIIRRFIKI